MTPLRARASKAPYHIYTSSHRLGLEKTWTAFRGK